MKTKSIIATGIAVALVALTAPAWAQQHHQKDYQLQLSAGGGVSSFIEDASDLTKVGGSWDVRVRLRTPLPIGAEIGDVGTANGVSDMLSANPPHGLILRKGF